MIVKHTKESLLAFEDKVADIFNQGKIASPVHLHNGNEDQLIDIYTRLVDEEDHLFCSWRSHYHCLLKGVPEDELLAEIMAGRSIALSFPKYGIYSSAIVGGNIPIATGYALAIKRLGLKHKAICFVGDMTAYTGTYQENLSYVASTGLPLLFVIENNNKSVCTITNEVWKVPDPTSHPIFTKYGKLEEEYYYTSKYPHAGAGQRVQF